MRAVRLFSTKGMATVAASSPATAQPLLLRGFSSSSTVLLQRRDGGGGYGNRDNGGYQQQRQNYPRGGGGFQQQQQQRQPSQFSRDRGGSYGRPRGYNNGNIGGRGGGNFGGRGGGRGEQPRRTPDQYLAQDAQSLVELKRQFKAVKSSRERRGVQREARRLIRRARVDPSTQDEKSVTILLNCAATFHAAPGEGIEQAVQWMRQNINGLSPQNVALFANALGVLQVPGGEAVLVEVVAPVVQAVAKEMTPVEVVMVLQAFQRERVDAETAELQDALLRQLAPCVAEMPVPQLSTLATVLARHHLKDRDREAWAGIVGATLKKAITGVEGMHSKEAITFLTAAAYLEMPQEQVVQLLQRATATVGFHTAEQVGELFRAVASIKRLTPDAGEELQRSCAGLEQALIGRLDRVAEFASVAQVATIWRHSHACGVELPASVQESLVGAVMTELAWVRMRFPALARLARAAAEQRLPSTEVLGALADYAIGKRPARHGGEPARVDERSMEEISAARGRLYTAAFAPLVALRVNLETAMAASGAQPNEALAQTLPEELARHAAEAAPRQALIAVEHVATAPANCPYRNTANDDAIVAAVEARLKADPAAFTERFTPAFIKRMVAILEDTSKGRTVAELLKAAAPK